MKKKLFISHASEDKEDFVRQLAEGLSRDFDVWYDEYQLVVGCSLLEEISEGLANCDFGVVVLSKHFFAKNWPQKELNGLSALEKKDKKVILPIWKGVSKEDVASYSPILADLMAAKAEDGVDNVVSEIKKAVAFFERGKSVERPAPGYDRLRTSIEKRTERERSESILWSQAGVSLAWDAGKETIHILREQADSLREQPFVRGVRVEGPKGDDISYEIYVWIGRICLYANYWNRIANNATEAQMNLAVFEADTDPWGRPSQSRAIEKESYFLYVDMSDKRFWKSKTGQPMTPEQLVDTWLQKLSARIDGK